MIVGKRVAGVLFSVLTGDAFYPSFRTCHPARHRGE